jgi:hypothetical protein
MLYFVMPKRLLVFITLLSFCLQHTSAQINKDCSEQSSFVSNWQCLGPFNTSEQLPNQHFGAIAAIAVNPDNENQIYIGTTNSGLFYTSNQGKTWQCLTDACTVPVIGVNVIHVNFNSTPHQLAIATGRSHKWYDVLGAGILLSSNGGKSWQRRYPDSDQLISSPVLTCFLIDSVHQVWYAASNNKIYRSENQGLQWTTIFSRELFPQAIHADDFQITSLVPGKDFNSIWFGTRFYQSGITRTNESFVPACYQISNCRGVGSKPQLICYNEKLDQARRPLIDTELFLFKLFAAPENPNTINIVRQHAGHQESILYDFDTETEKITGHRSPNNGHFGEDLEWFYGLIVNPKNPMIRYYGGTILFKSEDAGTLFKSCYAYGTGEQHEPHPDIRSMQLIKPSEDGQSDHIYLGTDGGLSFSDDGGKHFINLNGPFLPITEFYGMGVSPYSGMISAGSQDNSIFSYNPIQQEWTTRIFGDGYDVEYSQSQPGVMYGQYNAFALYQSSKDKVPMDKLLKSASPGASHRKTLVTHPNGNLYFADTEFHILKPGSKKWNSYPIGSTHQALSFAVSTSNPDIIYVSGYWNKLYKSIDGGQHFADISALVTVDGQANAETRIYAICIHPDDPDQVWISQGYLGNYQDICQPGKRILYTSDGGLTWKDYSDGLPTYNVTDMVFVDGTTGTIFAATTNGVYIRTGISDKWKLFASGLPKCLITELKISYCRNKLLASTYGRGLWETALPDLNYNQPFILKGTTRIDAKDSTTRFFTRDIKLHRKAKLIINGNMHMAKGKTIFVHKLNQVVIEKNGTILNACNESWNGIQRIKYKKSF